MRFWDFCLNAVILLWLIWNKYSTGWEDAGYACLIALFGACLGGRITAMFYDGPRR